MKCSDESGDYLPGEYDPPEPDDLEEYNKDEALDYTDEDYFTPIDEDELDVEVTLENQEEKEK